MSKKYLKSPQWLRNIKPSVQFLKFYKERQPQLIDDGGWHFSFLKSPEEIKKIESYSHQEFNKENFNNTNNIAQRILNGKDLIDRKIEYKKVQVDQSFLSIFQNKQKFKEDLLRFSGKILNCYSFIVNEDFISFNIVLFDAVDLDLFFYLKVDYLYILTSIFYK